MLFLKEFLEKVDFQKKSADKNSLKNAQHAKTCGYNTKSNKSTK